MCDFGKELLDARLDDHRLTQTSIRVRIPKNHHQDPVISRLVSQYGLTVNITAAILGANANGDGWFALELKGSHVNIQNALTYLHELDFELWHEHETDGW